MIEVRDAVCAYGAHQVLRGVSMQVPRGGITGLLGPNGSGKSTCLKVLSGVLPLQRGRVLLEGRPLSSYAPKERARLLACAPQRGEAPDGLRLRDLVLLGRYPHLGFWNGYGPADYAAADAALKAVDLEHLAMRRGDQVSGGELQRAFLARALAQEARVLLLDEPAAGLDPAHAKAACEILAASNERGATVLMASHDLNLAALYCHRLVFLKRGRVLAQGATREVFTREILESVYETPFLISDHPLVDAPQAVLVPAAAACASGGGPRCAGA